MNGQPGEPIYSYYFLEPCDPTPTEFNKRFWLKSHVSNKILNFSLKDTSKGDFIKCPTFISEGGLQVQKNMWKNMCHYVFRRERGKQTFVSKMIYCLSLALCTLTERQI